MAKIEQVDVAPAGPDVVKVVETAVAETATAAAAAIASSVNDTEHLSSDFQMDPAYTTSEELVKSLKKSDAASKRNKDTTETLKTVAIVSAAVVAVVGVLFAVSKNFKKVS